MLKIGDYVEGFEQYGYKIARVRGWISKIEIYESRAEIWLQCDDCYNGARGNCLIYGNPRFPITKLEDRPRPSDSDRALCGIADYERFDFKVPFIIEHNFNSSIVCFDIDGVLAEYRFGNGVYACKDSEFPDYCKKHNVYAEASAPLTIKSFMNRWLNVNQRYCISKAYCDEERDQKIKFVTEQYEIPREQIYFVDSNEQKLYIMKQIASLNDDVDEQEIFMVDDSIEVLGHIYENSNFGTIHISSLLEWR